MRIIKKLLLGIIINSACIWVAAQLLPGFQYNSNIYTLPTAGLVLAILDKTIKPLLKIVFLPINIITLGLFSWVISAVVVFLLSFLVNQITIKSFFYTGINQYGFVIPSLQINKTAVVFISALIIRVVNSFFYWLIK